LFDLYTKSVGRGGLLLLNVPPNRDGVICEQDRKSLVGFRRFVEQTYAHNLLEQACLKASNVRDRQARFAASHLLEAGEETFWATDDTVTDPTLEARFSQPVDFDVVRLKEATQFGQRIDAVAIDVWDGSGFREIARATSIGICRIVRLDRPVQTSRVRIRIQPSSASVVLAEAGLHRTLEHVS
jgi:alpha-L-fucosidase